MTGQKKEAQPDMNGYGEEIEELQHRLQVAGSKLNSIAFMTMVSLETSLDKLQQNFVFILDDPIVTLC